MPIKILRTGLPVTGFAKLGEATPKSSRMRGAPYKFDHIELTGTERDGEGRLIPDPLLMKAVIEQGAPVCGGCDRSKQLAEACDEPLFEAGLPTAIGIFLPYNDLELIFPHRLAYYKGRTAFCTGDGEQAMRLESKGKKKVAKPGAKNGEKIEIPQWGAPQPHGPCGPICPDFETRRCRPNGKLRFVLGIQQSIGGCFEFRTTSWNSIANLNESLRLVQFMTQGNLEWIPLLFEIQRQTVQPKEGGAATTAWIARVRYPGGPQQLLGAVRESLQLRAPVMTEVRQLAAQLRDGAWDETPDEVEAIEAEFYTEEAPAPGAPATPEMEGEGDAEAPESEPDAETGDTREPAPQAGGEERPAAPAPAAPSVGDEVPKAPGPPVAQESPDQVPLLPEERANWEKITKAQRELLKAKARQRAKELGLEEEAGGTVLSKALRGIGINLVDDVRGPELDKALKAIESYEIPESAA